MRKRFVLVLVIASFFAGGCAVSYESIYPRTPVGKIEIKQIPARTAIATHGNREPIEGRNDNFRKLFGFIKRNDLAMTVPVEAGVTTDTMNFFVAGKDSAKPIRSDANVTVQKLEPITVVSFGMRGSYTQQHYEQGLQKINEWLAANPDWLAQGAPYAVYWNSPFVLGFLKKSEVHQPVRPRNDESKLRYELRTEIPLTKKKEHSMSVYDFTMKDIDGKDVKLDEFRGKVVMIVNVASKCGFTPQYAGLEKLYKNYKDRGFVILGFPANNFLRQEPGTDAEIKTFCTSKYNVTFPMFSKISVKGKDQHPLYAYLTDKKNDHEFGGAISWNFNKFLVSKDGKIVARFGSKTTPEDEELAKAVETELKKK